MGKIFKAIDRQIIRPRAVKAEQEGYMATLENLESFYSQGSPKKYVRTGALGESPEHTGVAGGNGNYEYRIYLEPPEYTTGTYSGQKVLEEAQYHGSGILGRAGTWYESEYDIKEAVERNFK